MSSTIVRSIATKRSGQALPRIDKNQAVSLVASFDKVKPLLEGYPPPKRPNRNRPVASDDRQLQCELDAWELASDEALQSLDDSLAD